MMSPDREADQRNRHTGERNRAVAEYNKAVQSGIDYDNAQAVAKKYLAAPYDPKAEQTAAN